MYIHNLNSIIHFWWGNRTICSLFVVLILFSEREDFRFRVWTSLLMDATVFFLLDKADGAVTQCTHNAIHADGGKPGCNCAYICHREDVCHTFLLAVGRSHHRHSQKPGEYHMLWYHTLSACLPPNSVAKFATMPLTPPHSQHASSRTQQYKYGRPASQMHSRAWIAHSAARQDTSWLKLNQKCN